MGGGDVDEKQAFLPMPTAGKGVFDLFFPWHSDPRFKIEPISK